MKPKFIFQLSVLLFMCLAMNGCSSNDENSISLLQNKTWILVSYGNESNENIKEANGYYYLIYFHTDGTYSGQISCNTMGGEYSHKGNEIKITHPLMTQLGCEGEDPDKFFQSHLSDVYSYKVTDMELRLYYSKDQFFKFRIK